MRFLALAFPRLSIQLARADRPEFADRPFALLSGDGDAALLAAVSVEATAEGIECGMTALQARQRCPGILLERDNARECLERLEAIASILKTRATTSVAIVSRNAIALELDGIIGQFEDEAAAARSLLGFVRSWTGLDVRAGVASAVESAVCAAKTARRFPAVVPPGDDTAASLPRFEPLRASFEFAAPAGAPSVRTRLASVIRGLQPLLDSYERSYRRVDVEVERGPQHEAVRLRAPEPLHRAGAILELLRTRIADTQLEGATAVRITLAEAGPSVAVAPWRAQVATLHQLAGPAVPVQRRLRLAS